MPVGCNGLEDWLLDSVDVPKLIPLLRKGAALLCTCGSYTVDQPAQQLGENEVPTPVSVDELMARRPGKADNPFVEGEAAEEAGPVNEHEPKLDLPQLHTGMTLNCSSCSNQYSHIHYISDWFDLSKQP